MTSPASRRRSATTLRITSVDALRGVAALSVCIFHFLTARESPYVHLFARSPLQYGWLGVQAFFVISGFVVPLAMYRGDYSLADFPRFMVKRVVRLDPPYLVSIVIALALNLVAPGTAFDPTPLLVTPTALVGHVFYGFSHLVWPFAWFNSVYWTLEIEFQYYVAVALLLPLLISTKPWRNVVPIVLFMVAPFAAFSSLALFRWGTVFSFGLALFMWTSGLWSRRMTFLAFAIIAPVSWVTVGKAATLVAIGTTILIVCWTRSFGVFDYLGRISFSLYLVHLPIGGRLVMAAGQPRVRPIAAFGLVALAFIVSFAAADLLWRTVERPAQALAKKIRYRERRSTLVVAQV